MEGGWSEGGRIVDLATFTPQAIPRREPFAEAGAAMAATVVAEVLENRDLVKLVVGTDFRTSDTSDVRAWMLQEIRAVQMLRRVNRLFNELARGALDAFLEHYHHRMNQFERVSVIASCRRDAAILTTNQFSAWPMAVFDIDPRLADNAADLYFMRDQFMRRRDPENCDELADLLERRCACCGEVCSWIAKDREKIPLYRPWIENRPSFAAYGMHPYLGKRVICQNFDVLQGTLIPFTHQDHFFEVAFVHELETSEFTMRLHVYASMTGDELRFSRFLIGAGHEPWFAENIKRIFRMRDAKLFCEERNRRRVVFLATICMFHTTFSDPTDWSVQSIFGLSSKELMATVRRGSAMQRERRLLA